MPSASSRRVPWPGDLLLGDKLMMLVEGTMVSKKTQSLENVAPAEQDYGSAPVYKEKTWDFKPTRGMGERVQSSHTSRRYHYGLNVWVVGGLWGKGPLTHTLTPATTGSIRDFVDALNGGVLAQFILAGASVLVRSGDTNGTQTVSETRVGHIATSGVRFRGAYVTPIDGLYVAWDDGVLRQYTGAAWVAAALPAGFLPQFLEVLGDELWAADPTNSVIRKVTGDPLLAGSWGGPILVGNPATKITSIKQVDNRLAIFKEDGGIFTVNGDGSDNDLFPGVRVTIDPTNARTAQAWLDSLWFRMGESFYQLSMSGGPTLTSVGPERMLNHASELRGPVQAFAGYGTMGSFVVTYSPAGNSYLLQYGNWIPASEAFAAQSATLQYADQYDGAVVKWTGKRVTAMRVSGIAAPDTRLYVGFSDGSWDWIKLVPNPLAPSSGAEFTLAASKMYAPGHTAMFQADWKTTNGFSAFGPVLTPQDYVQIAYRRDGSSAAYTALGGSFVTSGQRLDTPSGTVDHVLDVEISLINTTTADSPVLEGIGIHESVRPALKLDRSGTIDARSRVALRDGSTSRLTAEQIHDTVLQIAGMPGTANITLPDESIEGLSFFGYQETLLPRNQRNGVGWKIEFQATQFKTVTVYGTIGRLKGTLIGDLRGVTIGQLRTW